MFNFIRNLIRGVNTNFLDCDWWKSATSKDVAMEVVKGADVNTKDKEGRSVLVYAARFNQNPEIIRTLVKLGADVNAKNKDGWTVLMLVECSEPNPKIIKTLIELGADINAKNNDGLTVLALVAQFNQKPEIVRALVELGADVNVRDTSGLTILMHMAQFCSNPEIIRTLVELGADVNAKDKDGWTALTYAERFRSNPKIIKILVELGANVNKKDKDNRLDLKSRKQNKKSIQSLEKSNEKQNVHKNPLSAKDKKTENHSHNKEYDHLIQAIQNNNINGVKRYALPQYINKHNSDTFTPLMYAIIKKDIEPEILHILLSRGANLSEQYEIGGIKHTALQLAIMQYRIENTLPLEEISCFCDISEKRLGYLTNKLNIQDQNNSLNEDSNYLGYGRYDFSTVGSWSKGDEKNPDDADDYS